MSGADALRPRRLGAGRSSTCSTRCCAGSASRCSRAGFRSSSSSPCWWRSTPLLGGYMARVFTGERVVPHAASSGRSSGCSTGSCASTRARAGLEGATRASLIVFSGAVLARAVRDPAHADAPPLEPAGLPLGHLGRDLQHRLVVHHEHELAVLRRRDDADVLQPDGGADGAELRLRGRRHRGADRADPRHLAPQRHEPRQLLAGPRRARCSTCCCRSRSSARWCSSRRA